jgi:Holliday junction resolvasome RuvABC endonuclease subunit
MPNWYTTRDSLKRAVRSNGNENDEALDRLIEAASRDVDNATHRWFIPKTQTRLFRWPGRYGLGDLLWLDADLISVTTLQTKAQDSSPTTIASSDYFLEPANTAPPYSRIEIDISSNAAFESGDTSQRSISVAGSWGFSNDTVSVGTVSSGLASDSTATSMVCSNGSMVSGVAVGDTLLIESEQLFVTEKTAAALASILINGARTADKSENLIVDGGTHGISVGEVIRVDSEEMFVRGTTSTTVTVERAYNGTTLAAHNNDTAVHIFRTLTVTRGVNGTTAATHANSTAVSAYRAPAPIRELTQAIAIAAFTQEAAAWGRSIGAGDAGIEMTGRELGALMQRITEQYLRPREYAL